MMKSDGSLRRKLRGFVPAEAAPQGFDELRIV